MSGQGRGSGETRAIRISAAKKFVAACLSACAALLRAWNGARRSTEARPRRVLLLEPFGLGDLISFEPMVRCLRDHGYEVVICAKREWRRLFPEGAGLNWVDTAIPWATHNEQAKYRFASYFQRSFQQCLAQMRSLGQGAIGVDTRGDIRSVLVLQWIGCARVLSLDTYLGSNVRVWNAAAELVPFSSRLRRWQLNLAFCEPLGLKLDSASVSPPFFSHLAEKERRSQTVGFMPVAPWRGKLWLSDRWHRLRQQLEKGGWRIRVFCGPGQLTLAREQVGADIEIVECTSIESWADQLTCCRVVVTLDSGPMHLADALDVPVVALFGQGWLPFWAPSAKHSRVLAHQNDPDFAVCHPIDANIPLGQKYMSRIEVEEVSTAVEETLAAVYVEQNGNRVHLTNP